MTTEHFNSYDNKIASFKSGLSPGNLLNKVTKIE